MAHQPDFLDFSRHRASASLGDDSGGGGGSALKESMSRKKLMSGKKLFRQQEGLLYNFSVALVAHVRPGDTSQNDSHSGYHILGITHMIHITRRWTHLNFLMGMHPRQGSSPSSRAQAIIMLGKWITMSRILDKIKCSAAPLVHGVVCCHLMIDCSIACMILITKGSLHSKTTQRCVVVCLSRNGKTRVCLRKRWRTVRTRQKILQRTACAHYCTRILPLLQVRTKNTVPLRCSTKELHKIEKMCQKPSLRPKKTCSRSRASPIEKFSIKFYRTNRYCRVEKG